MKISLGNILTKFPVYAELGFGVVAIVSAMKQAKAKSSPGGTKITAGERRAVLNQLGQLLIKAGADPTDFQPEVIAPEDQPFADAMLDVFSQIHQDPAEILSKPE